MGVDITKQDFTTVGIGDMAGDVFGNGMLLSDHICMVAAFNHMHIFIDPTPDAKASFEERKRLFVLPRSTWKDYNASLISKGGGVFERSAKTLNLSKEARDALGIEKSGAQASQMTPDEVIRAILLAPVDLLWNGGIGTYVKAEEETHDQVGDRANNAVRVNGKELRCKIVGEGGNLGFTQKGRIEYARNGIQGLGGRINTDAIDNSAGVDCSDHEVNIKIAFSGEMAKGKLTMAERDKQLVAMTDDVARLVLKDNILQTQALTIAEQQGVRLLESQARLMHMLERHGLLNRAIEYLPTDKQLSELRVAKKGLTRPELAVLLSYSKMFIYNEILESTLPDEPYFTSDLKRYFPPAMLKKFEEAVITHPLKREIIATVVTNSIVNRAGITFFSGISEDLGVSARDIAAAYTLARDAFDLRGLWKEIEEADGVHVSIRAAMYGAASEFLERVTSWLLRNLPLPLNIDRVHQEIVPGIVEIEKNKDKLYTDVTRQAYEQRLAALKEQGVPEKLAVRVSGLELMSSAFDIISVGHQTKLPLTQVGKIYFELDDRLSLAWLRLSAGNIATASHWERLAVQAIIGDLYDEQRRLTAHVISETCKDGICTDSVASWAAASAEDILRFERFMDDMKAGDTPDIPRLMVALRHIRSL
jgi:glutamate dehydrogenase